MAEAIAAAARGLAAVAAHAVGAVHRCRVTTPFAHHVIEELVRAIAALVVVIVAASLRGSRRHRRSPLGGRVGVLPQLLCEARLIATGKGSGGGGRGGGA